MKKHVKRTRRISSLLGVSFILMAFGGCGLREEALPGASFAGNTASEHITTNGRVYYEDNELKLFWTSSGFSFNFYGTGAEITASANSDHNAPGSSLLNVYVDGSYVPAKTIQLTSLTPKKYTLIEDLPAGGHTIRVVKRVQPTQYDQINIGIREISLLGSNAAFNPAPLVPDRQIEFLGDSITCGQGNLLYDDMDNKGVSGALAEDGTMTYAALTAASFQASNQTLSRSGIKFIRADADHMDYSILNDAGKPRADGRDSLADYYTKTAAIPSFEANTAEWGFERPSDVVVINLGTNDDGQYQYGRTDVNLQAWYQSEAEYLLQLVRQKNPNAVIVWCYGMMGENARTADPIKAAVRARNQAGDREVYYLSLANSTDVEGRGDGHPTVAGNINRSFELVQFIAEKTGWEYSFLPQLVTKLHTVEKFSADAADRYSKESAEAFLTSVNEAYALIHNYDQIQEATQKIQETFRALEKSYQFISRDGWTATAELNPAQAGNALSGRADGDLDRWTTGQEQNSAIKGTWFQIDRGAGNQQVYDGIHINFGPSGDYPRGSIVFLSDDPAADWAGGDYTKWKGRASAGGTNLVDTYDIPGSTARYIRIVYTAEAAAAWWSIYEFNLYRN